MEELSFRCIILEVEELLFYRLELIEVLLDLIESTGWYYLLKVIQDRVILRLWLRLQEKVILLRILRH